MSEQEQAAEALARVLADYAWLTNSVLALCDTAERAGRDVVRIAQVRGAIEVTSPLPQDLDAALGLTTAAPDQAAFDGGKS